MTQAALLPLLYDPAATGGWSAGMVRVTLALLAGVPLPPGARALEVGCGHGAMVRALQAAYPAVQVVGCDLHPAAALAVSTAVRTASGAGGAFVQADLLRPPFARNCADLLLALDAFDQAGVDLGAALAAAHRTLRPGGWLLLRVSAYPWLHGAHDVAFNTGRRYARAELQAALARAGFAVRRVTHANALLAAPVILLRLLDNWRSRAQHTAHTGVAAYGSPAANRAVAAALALEARLLRRANLPAGLSLIVLAQRG